MKKLMTIAFVVLAMQSFAQTGGNDAVTRGQEATRASMGNLGYSNGDGSKDLKYAVDPPVVDIYVPDPYIPQKKEPSVVKEVTVHEVRVKHSWVAVFEVRENASTAATTEKITDRKIARFKSSLGRIGIYNSAIQSRLVSMVPIYTVTVNDSPYLDDPGKQHMGYEMVRSVKVTFTKEDQLDTIIRLANQAGISQLLKTEHIIEKY